MPRVEGGGEGRGRIVLQADALGQPAADYGQQAGLAAAGGAHQRQQLAGQTAARHAVQDLQACSKQASSAQELPVPEQRQQPVTLCRMCPSQQESIVSTTALFSIWAGSSPSRCAGSAGNTAGKQAQHARADCCTVCAPTWPAAAGWSFTLQPNVANSRCGALAANRSSGAVHTGRNN